MDEIAAIFGPITMKVKRRNGAVEHRREDLGRWRDMGGQSRNPALTRAGENYQRDHVRERAGMPSGCHVQAGDELAARVAHQVNGERNDTHRGIRAFRQLKR